MEDSFQGTICVLKVSQASASAVCTDMETNMFVELKLNANLSQAQVGGAAVSTTRLVTSVHPHASWRAHV